MTNSAKILKIFYMFGKERQQQHDQEPQLQRMRGLEERNHTLDDKLFSVVGNGKHRAFCFPISLSRQTSHGIVDEFLVVTADGNRAIQVDRGSTISFPHLKTIGEIITRRLGKKPHLFSSGRGFINMNSANESLHIKNGLSIGLAKTRGVFLEFDAEDASCRLVAIDGDRVEQLLQANIQRVREVQATSQRVSSVFSKAS